jgi:ribosomal-protein-alanine N-acetyltransferase
MTTPMVHLIRASFAHVPLLAALQNASFPNDPWPESAFAPLLIAPPGFGLLAVNDSPIGFALARVIVDEAEIISLGIAPTARRQGYARAILLGLIDQCRLRGAATLFLEVAARNEPAKALYRTHGFLETGKRPHYYPNGDDALLMRSLLQPEAIP